MAESTGHPAASTLHSTLSLFADEEDQYISGSQPLEADLVIVDKVSMIDMRLAAELFRRIETDTQLLLVGDLDQLPSVGPGNVLRELLRCGLIPTIHLDIAYRQKNASRIALNAHTINEGDKDSLAYGEDFRFLPAEQAGEAAQIVLDVYQEAVTHQNLLEVQILAPFRSRGECSVKRLNEEIQKLINPPDPCKKELKYGAQVFRELDKVIQTKNREGGSIRQYCFDGKQCRDKSPLLIWPENPKPPKEGQSVYRLPFSIQGELELYAESSEKAYTTFGLFDSEDFLFHLLTLFQKNGIGAYLRPDEMKKAERKADALIS